MRPCFTGFNSANMPFRYTVRSGYRNPALTCNEPSLNINYLLGIKFSIPVSTLIMSRFSWRDPADVTLFIVTIIIDTVDPPSWHLSRQGAPLRSRTDFGQYILYEKLRIVPALAQGDSPSIPPERGIIRVITSLFDVTPFFVKRVISKTMRYGGCLCYFPHQASARLGWLILFSQRCEPNFVNVSAVTPQSYAANAAPVPGVCCGKPDFFNDGAPAETIAGRVGNACWSAHGFSITCNTLFDNQATGVNFDTTSPQTIAISSTWGSSVASQTVSCGGSQITRKGPLGMEGVPRRSRFFLRIWIAISWPWQVRRLKREGFRRTGWRTWEYRPEEKKPEAR